MNLTSVLQESYTELAPYSNRHRWEFYNNLKHLAYIQQHIPTGARILDVGCGIGILDLALQKIGFQVTGLDKYIFLPDTYLSIHNDGLESLEEKWRRNNLSIIDGDIYNFCAPHAYDTVINIAVIEHQKNPKQFIRLCIQYLSLGGYFLCVTPNMTDVLNRFRFLCGRSAFRDLRPFFEAGEGFVGHWREYTLSELTQMITWSGLNVIDKKNYRTSPLFNGKDKFPRNIWLALFKILSSLVPSAKDTNMVLGRKTEDPTNYHSV